MESHICSQLLDQSRLGVRQTLQTDGVKVELAGAGKETHKCNIRIFANIDATI